MESMWEQVLNLVPVNCSGTSFCSLWTYSKCWNHDVCLLKARLACRSGWAERIPGGLCQPDSALGAGAAPGGRQGPLGSAEPRGEHSAAGLALPLLVPHRTDTKMVLEQHQARGPAHSVTRGFFHKQLCWSYLSDECNSLLKNPDGVNWSTERDGLWETALFPKLLLG